MDRFLREIKVHARLAHPNIVTFHNAADIDGELVMTYEFFEAITLEKRLERGRMPVREAVSCMSQVLAALACAHEHGVTHREVSSANVLLAPDGMVKLTGFGLAKSASDPQLTQAGTVMGWIEYMAPEQIKGLATLDHRADIYSAGAMLYEMVTGRVPFTGKSQFDVMMAHVNTPPEPPISLNSDLSPEISQVILTALAKQAEHRFQTAAQFRQALEGAGTAPSAPAPKPVPVAAPIPVPVVANAVSASEGSGFEKLLLTGLLTFLVVAVAFFAYLKSLRP
jgi:serine/threonine-protein kinase